MSKIILSYLFKTHLSAFRTAIVNDNTDKICRILDIERDYLNQYIDNDGNTPLLLAIEYASPLTVRLLLEQGAEPNQPNQINCRTPLCFLASNQYEDFSCSKAKRDVEMAKILLDYGAFVDKLSIRLYKDENDKDYSGKETALMMAVRKRNLPLTKLLIERNANVNYCERHSQIRAIHLAVDNGDENIFDCLINARALCSSLVSVGSNTILHWFCYNKANDQHTSLLKKIIEQGCDLNSKNWNGHTPLMLAAKENMFNTCSLLVKSGADANQTDEFGNRAISFAISNSESWKLLSQLLNDDNQKSNSSSILTYQLSSKIISRDRTLRRMNTDSCDIDSEELKERYCSPEDSNLKQKNIGIHHPYIVSDRRRDSDDINRRYERLWGKILHINGKQRTSKKKLSKQRSSSMQNNSKETV